MMIKEIANRLLPSVAMDFARDFRRRRQQKRVQALPKLSEIDIHTIIVKSLRIRQGDIVFVHSSIDKLHINFPFYRFLAILRETVGEQGTILFPTYPKLTSYKFLKSGEVFDVLKTPSYTGILTEFARRQRSSVRSLHPTKSVVALGPMAEKLTAGHSESPYPYDSNSPYFKVIENGGKAIGIGVATVNLSLVHCIDDAFKESFSVQPYHNEIFTAQCIDKDRNSVGIKTYAHDMRKMKFDIPGYMEKYIQKDIAEDITINGASFFRVDTQPLFERMIALAKQGITIYPRHLYK